MEEVTRKRVTRMLEALPEEQLYQVLDYIEFLELKYARAAVRKPDPFQQFAERVEDQMRLRSVAPKAMKGTMKLMSTAGRMIDGVRELGKDVAGRATPPRPTGKAGAEVEGDLVREDGEGGGAEAGGTAAGENAATGRVDGGSGAGGGSSS